jgi:DNA repair photolyase
MIVNHKDVKSVISKSNLPIAGFTVNPYVGCAHACKYCYADFMKRFTGHKEEWGTFVDVKHWPQIKNPKKYDEKTIIIGSVTDPYHQCEKEFLKTREFLEELKGVDVNLIITTKSSLISRDLDLIKTFPNPIVSLSINTLDEDARNKAFNGKSLSLEEIGRLISELPAPKRRKYTLNFAVTSESNLDPVLMDKYFDKTKCIVKITPIHETYEAVINGYEIVKKFDVYEKFEKPLVDAGWDVIVFVPSEEEDADRITCGNSLIAKASK